jgi:hypothetical protein
MAIEIPEKMLAAQVVEVSQYFPANIQYKDLRKSVLDIISKEREWGKRMGFQVISHKMECSHFLYAKLNFVPISSLVVH